MFPLQPLADRLRRGHGRGRRNRTDPHNVGLLVAWGAAGSWSRRGVSSGCRRAWQRDRVTTMPAPPARPPRRPGPGLGLSLIVAAVGLLIGIVSVVAIVIPLVGVFTSDAYTVRVRYICT